MTKLQLKEMLERSAENWVAQGHWLQVSGLAFKHDPRKPEGQRVSDIHLFQNGTLKELPDRSFSIVTNKFLMKDGDGYDMLKPLQWVSVAPSLKEHIQNTLKANPNPIHPQTDGRICNVADTGNRPCAFKMSAAQ